jgi:RNA ligase (TIGR02306 family)
MARKLVTVERILDVRPIADANAIEAITVRGWTVVSKKGEFRVGDACVYFEIDAALPLSDARFAFLAARSSKVRGDGSSVHVLKTARLRGVYSQGLALPLPLFPEVSTAVDGTNFATLLAVETYEAPMPASMATTHVGPFPTELARKTDAERAQNLVEQWPQLLAAGPWVATEKLDGTSLTVINDGGALRVCGRNYELRDGANVYWEIVRKSGADIYLQPGEVLQGEVYGEGVQGNPLKLRERTLGAFGFFRGRVSIPRDAWPAWLKPFAVATYDELTLPTTVEQAVAQVDGILSLTSPTRAAEGVVWTRVSGEPLRELDDRASFKVISNKYLLKHDT